MSEMLNILSPILVGVLSVVISVIGYLLKKTVMEKLDSVENKLTEFEKGFQGFREEIIKEYITKADFKGNTESHEKLWTELNGIKERLAVVETKGRKK